MKGYFNLEEHVKNEYGVDIYLKSRKQKNTYWRHLSIYVLYQQGYTNNRLIELFKYHHATIMYIIRKIQDLIQIYPVYKKDYEELMKFQEIDYSLSEKIHANAKEKGFWNEPNTERTILLIISELYEAFESLRKDKIYRGDSELEFEKNVKDTAEDEFADVVIRLLDLYSYYGGIDVYERKLYKMIDIDVKSLIGGFKGLNLAMLELIEMNQYERVHYIPKIVKLVYEFYDTFGFLKPLQWHIHQKMEYNSNREYLHGKKY